jgi:hypothetical protein
MDTHIREQPKVPKPQRSRRLLIGGGVIAAALVVGVGARALTGPADRNGATPTPSDASASSITAPAVRIVLDPPIDNRSSVDLRWSGGTDVDYAVIVAGADQPSRTVFAHRKQNLRIAVETDRGYCFMVQATDGRAVYQSETRSIRGAACRLEAPRS